ASVLPSTPLTAGPKLVEDVRTRGATTGVHTSLRSTTRQGQPQGGQRGEELGAEPVEHLRLVVPAPGGVEELRVPAGERNPRGVTSRDVGVLERIGQRTPDRATLSGHLVTLGGEKEQRSEEHTSELQSREKLVCRLLLEKKKPPPTS